MARAPEPAWFTASEDRLFKAAVQTAMALGYSVKHTDPSMRVIAFNTGMSMRSWAGQDMSVSVVQGDGGRNGVIIGGTRAQLALGGVPQVFDWGERGKIARTFLQKFEEILPRTAEAAVPILKSVGEDSFTNRFRNGCLISEAQAAIKTIEAE